MLDLPNVNVARSGAYLPDVRLTATAGWGRLDGAGAGAEAGDVSPVCGIWGSEGCVGYMAWAHVSWSLSLPSTIPSLNEKELSKRQPSLALPNKQVSPAAHLI